MHRAPELQVRATWVYLGLCPVCDCRKGNILPASRDHGITEDATRTVIPEGPASGAVRILHAPRTFLQNRSISFIPQHFHTPGGIKHKLRELPGSGPQT